MPTLDDALLLPISHGCHLQRAPSLLEDGCGKLAVLSDDLRYRYLLLHVWEPEKPSMAWVLLNPSTADAFQDDATITRCAYRARVWGYGGMYVANLFAYRATNPTELSSANVATIGVSNDAWLSALLRSDLFHVVGWGSDTAAKRHATYLMDRFAARRRKCMHSLTSSLL